MIADIGDELLLQSIYENEMTVTQLVENQAEYIESMEDQLTKVKDMLYDANVLVAELDRLIGSQPLTYKDIKKATDRRHA